jgi:GNAT superfamily N-acetyltransferase
MGTISLGNVHIDIFVIPETLRGNGLGKRLITRAGAEARRWNCHLMRLESYRFLARPSYEPCGFQGFRPARRA